jgi:hypothetical protein
MQEDAKKGKWVYLSQHWLCHFNAPRITKLSFGILLFLLRLMVDIDVGVEGAVSMSEDDYTGAKHR